MLLTTTRDRMARQRPLLLLTRPGAASEAFAAALPEEVRKAVDFLINPLLSIHVTGPLPPLTGISGLIFTSANALDAYRSLDGPDLQVPAITVGEATANAARKCGFDVDIAGGTAEHLVRHIVDRGYAGPLMHLRGEVAIGDVAQRLNDAGVEASEAVVYRQQLEPFTPGTREAVSQDRPVVAPVFSARTAGQLGREAGGLTHIRFAAISRSVADALPNEAATRTQIAAKPNRDGMVDLVVEMVAEAAALERRM